MLTAGGATQGRKQRLQVTTEIDEVREALQSGFGKICFKGIRGRLAWNDVGVGDTGQPLEAVALLIFARYLDEEALGRGAELREAPEALLAEVRGQRYGDCAQGAA